MMLAGCLSIAVVLCAPPCDAEEQSHPIAPKASGPRLLIVFVGGMDSDPTPEQIAGTAKPNLGNSGLFQLAGAFQEESVITSYFNWNGTRAGAIGSKDPPRAEGIAAFIRAHVDAHPRDSVALVGNSWGGHTVWTVCRALAEHPRPLAIEQVIFLDPSSAGEKFNLQAKPDGLPVNVIEATNYFTRNIFVWKNWSDNPRIEHVDLGNPENGYMRRGKPEYGAALSFPAHVAAEWDPRIHADIERRLRRSVPSVNR